MKTPPSPLWTLFFISCIVFFIFSPALNYPFHWDDDVHLYDNPQVKRSDVRAIRDIFRSQVNNTYVPLTIFSFSLEYRWFKDRPFMYRLNNILLHVLIVVLVFVLALRLGFTFRSASLSALLFAIHPMHVEPVVWITQRKDVLYAALYLLSLVYYLKFVSTRRVCPLILSVFLGFLSVLAKPMALSLPLILLFLDWYLKRQWSTRLLLEKIPFALTIFPIAWITYALNMRSMDFVFPQSLLTWIWSAVFYVSKFLWPLNLSILYELPQPVGVTRPAFIGALFVFFVLCYLIFRFRRQRVVLFAFGFYILSIFFLLRFDNQKDLTFVADRFMYLPSLGFCFLFGFLVDQSLIHWGEKKREFRRFILALTVMVIFAGAALSYERVKQWKDDGTLWLPVLKNSKSAVAFNQAGNYYLNQKDYQSALDNYSQAIVLNPEYHKARGNRGLVYFHLGLYEEALNDFTTAIRLNPQDAARAYNNRGYLYWKLKQWTQALADYNRAIDINDEDVLARMNRATLYKDLGDYDRSKADLTEILRRDPEHKGAINNMRILNQLIFSPAQNEKNRSLDIDL